MEEKSTWPPGRERLPIFQNRLHGSQPGKDVWSEEGIVSVSIRKYPDEGCKSNNSNLVQGTINSPLSPEGCMGTAEGKHWDEVKDDLQAHKAEDGDVVKARLHEWLAELLNTHAPSISVPCSCTSPLSPLLPLSPTSPLSLTSPTGNLNPFDLIRALPRPGFSRRPSSRSSSVATRLGGGSGSGLILVLTHQECLEKLAEMLNRDESVVEKGESENKAKTVPLSMYVSEGIDLKMSPVGNTSVAILRVWWEHIESGVEISSVLKARGRLEAWGMEDHLD
ncbi:hypothetical protein C349_06232 [Cryptococcus neoformans var. grubii Br795]|nr:hypothetical protein C368_01744 [Cryptococcus neoformans var. grubii 125.91]OXG45077.1 hypothetical protein C355_06184 [Cryptococcus neoformans var. grubii Th84]OXG73296.1 hypothetical protein C350_06120 [Cryptococcus neoformans var. grubii MW-RSA36]OXG74449.1 hypothetical protein C349_06232 [Cryptococcus neoformans var. grubii Br795]OXH01968.1 hypothetical protein J010_06169 [Cryptococcus neoformans var. grubii]OXL09553.1 hypothetical protein C348_01936 [Cryptococcus neoformans var. grubii